MVSCGLCIANAIITHTYTKKRTLHLIKYTSEFMRLYDEDLSFWHDVTNRQQQQHHHHHRKPTVDLHFSLVSCADK